MAIRTVLLDADGVVQSTPPGWLSRVESLISDSDKPEAFLADIFAAESPCLTGCDDFQPALKAVLARWGSEVSFTTALDLWTKIEVCRPVLDVVRHLRDTGYQVALATNQQQYRADYMRNELGYQHQFDRLFYSCEIGHAKPAAAYFDHVLEQLDELPTQVLFVDDQLKNVAAARQAGMQAEQFDLQAGTTQFLQLLARHEVVIH